MGNKNQKNGETVSEKELLQKSLCNALNFYFKREEYDKTISNASSKISLNHLKINQERQNFDKFKKTKLIIALIIGGVAILPFMIGFVNLLGGLVLSSPVQIGSVIIGSIFIVIALALVGVSIFFLATNKKRAEKYYNDHTAINIKMYEDEIVALEEQKATAEAEKAQLDAENVDCLSVMPISYRDDFSIAFALISIVNERADNIKEAINLFEEQLHNWKIERSLGSKSPIYAKTIEEAKTIMRAIGELQVD